MPSHDSHNSHLFHGGPERNPEDKLEGARWGGELSLTGMEALMGEVIVFLVKAPPEYRSFI